MKLAYSFYAPFDLCGDEYLDEFDIDIILDTESKTIKITNFHELTDSAKNYLPSIDIFDISDLVFAKDDVLYLSEDDYEKYKNGDRKIYIDGTAAKGFFDVVCKLSNIEIKKEEAEEY